MVDVCVCVKKATFSNLPRMSGEIVLIISYGVASVAPPRSPNLLPS